MPIEDAIKGTVDRRLQLKRAVVNLDTQIFRLTAQRDAALAEYTKLDTGIDALAVALKIPIEKDPKIVAAALEAPVELPQIVKG